MQFCSWGDEMKHYEFWKRSAFKMASILGLGAENYRFST
jgi:hypothetical protein